MAGNQDGHFVLPVGGGNGADGFGIVQTLRLLLVATRFAVRNRQERIPCLLLKFGTDLLQRRGKGFQTTLEVYVQFLPQKLRSLILPKHKPSAQGFLDGGNFLLHIFLPDKLQQTQAFATEHRQHLAQRRGNGGGGQFVQIVGITRFQQTDGAADTDIFFRRAADTVDKILLELLGFVFRQIGIRHDFTLKNLGFEPMADFIPF